MPGSDTVAALSTSQCLGLVGPDVQYKAMLHYLCCQGSLPCSVMQQSRCQDLVNSLRLTALLLLGLKHPEND